MVKLVHIDFEEFEKEIYLYYLDLFPESDEQKPLKAIQIPYLQGITKLVKIMDDDTTIGFLIYHTLPNNQYVLLDYFGIWKEFQNRGYGSKTIEVFREFFNEYNGIYG